MDTDQALEREIEQALGRLNRLNRRQLAPEYLLIASLDLEELLALYCGCVTLPDENARARADWFQRIDKLVSKYPEKADNHDGHV